MSNAKKLQEVANLILSDIKATLNYKSVSCQELLYCAQAVEALAPVISDGKEVE